MIYVDQRVVPVPDLRYEFNENSTNGDIITFRYFFIKKIIAAAVVVELYSDSTLAQIQRHVVDEKRYGEAIGILDWLVERPIKWQIRENRRISWVIIGS